MAERKPSIVKVQADHELMRERVVRLINPSGDPYDSFRNLTFKQISGISIDIPIGRDGSGAYVTQGGLRALPVTFECDYTQGKTRGEAELTYQHPRNLYDSISGFLVVECVPMGEEERARQIADKSERLRLAALRRDEEERSRQAKLEEELARQQARAAAEAARREHQAREAARQNSPQYKRDQAEQHIKRMRAEIRAAEARIADEQRVGKLSGYVDKHLLHELGSLIVAAEREIARSWIIYRNNGGASRSADEVR